AAAAADAGGAAAAADLGRRAGPAVEDVAAAVALLAAVIALGGAGAWRTHGDGRVQAGGEVEDHKLEDLLLRRHLYACAQSALPWEVARAGGAGGDVEVAVHDAATLICRRRSDRRVKGVVQRDDRSRRLAVGGAVDPALRWRDDAVHVVADIVYGD